MRRLAPWVHLGAALLIVFPLGGCEPGFSSEELTNISWSCQGTEGCPGGRVCVMEVCTPPDTIGPVMDADGVRDGSSPVDGSTTPDARVAMDADGVRDGASPTDGSPASDASVASDAASTFDGSSPVDGSTTADASVELDAAVDPDGMSPPDGSPVADVSGPLDALNDAEPRPVDGAVESDGGRRPDGSADAGVDGAVPVPAVCGDGNVQGEEACDDGNRVNTDLCTNSCETARCGDGIVQQGEACDGGDEIVDDACDAECTCGRFFTPMENGGQCADLNECLTDNGGCGEPDIFICENHDGRAPTCTCVDLEAVGPECTRCGDGVLQDEETCDDGNRIDFDGCDSLCRETSVEICLENLLVEECDPGGTVRTGSEHVGFQENPAPVHDGRFGRSVSVHRDIAVVGTQRGDAAYAYSISENGWGDPIQLERQNPQDGDKFGGAVAVSGDRVLVGAVLYSGGEAAPRVGAAYVYQKTQQGWQEAQLLQATVPGSGAQFGNSVAMDAAAPGGAIALVGEHLHSRVDDGEKFGAAYVFIADEQGVFRQESQLRAEDGLNCDLFGASVAISGATALVGASQQDIINACPRVAGPGAAYIFTQNAHGRWLQTTKLTPSDAQGASAFGKSVAVEGNIAVVGAPTDTEEDRQSTGAAYVFSRDQQGEWSQLQKIRPEPDEEVILFGYSIALSGDTLVIGAPHSDVARDKEKTGASLVFRRIEDGTFVRTDRVIAPDGRAFDRFGEAVAVSGAVAVVGRFQHNMGGDIGDNAGGVDLYFLDKPVCHDESDGVRAGCVCLPGAHGDNCLERSLCGDAVLDEAEQCDDGNENDGDGCDARCDREDCGAFGSPYGRPLLQTPAQRGALLVPDPNGTFAVMTSREVLLPRRFVHESQADFEVWNDLNVLVDPTDEDAPNPDFPEMGGIGGLLKVPNAVYLSSYYANRVWYVSSLLETHFFDLGAEALPEDPDMTKPIVRVEDSIIIGSGADLYGFDQSEVPRDEAVTRPLAWPENTPRILGTIRQLQGVDIRGDASPELVGFARGSNGQGTFFAISFAFEPGLPPHVSAVVTGTPPCPGGASNVTDVSVLLRDPPTIAVACKSNENVRASVHFAEITFPNELNPNRWLADAAWSAHTFGDGELHIDAGFIDDDAEPDLVLALEDPLACRGVARVMFNPAAEPPVALSPPITLGSLPRDVLVKDTDGDGRDEFIIVSHGDPNRPCGDALLRNQVDVFSHRPEADAAPRDGRGDVCVQMDAPDVDCPDMSCD